MKHLKESVEVVEWLRTQLQQTDQFNTGIRALWVRELTALIKELKSMDYVEVKPEESIKEVEKRIPRKGISLDKLKKI